MGGKFLLKLNTGERPIAYKYREGKVKETQKPSCPPKNSVDVIEVCLPWSEIDPEIFYLQAILGDSYH